MKLWFNDNDLHYWNSMLVLRTMYKDEIIDKKDLSKAEEYLSKKYRISKGSLVRAHLLESVLKNGFPR